MFTGTQLQLTRGPEELPSLDVTVESKSVKLLVDTGATRSVIKQADFCKHATNSTVFSVGVAGVLQKQSVTEPLQIQMDNLQLKHPFLLSDTVPLSLMGRDLLCKLGAKIFCSPSGITLDIPTMGVQQFFSNTMQTVDNDPMRVVTVCLEDIQLLALEEIKRLAKCCAAAAVILLTLRPVNKPFAFPRLKPEDTEVPLQYFYLCPLGLVLIVRKGVQLNTFIMAVKNDMSDAFGIITALRTDIDRMPQDKDEDKSYVVWSFGNDSNSFFIKMKDIVSLPIKDNTLVSEIELNSASILSLVPSHVWAKGPYEVGLLNIPPYRANIDYSKFPVYVKQYPLSKEKEEGIKPVIDSLLAQGVIIKKNVRCNTPLNPIRKQGSNKWRFTQDLRKINEIVFPIPPTVPDVNAILTTLPPQAKYYTVIDIASAYFSLGIDLETQELFGFTFQSERYCLTRLAMGFVDSANYYCNVIRWHLSHLTLPGNSVLSIYFDDLLISSENEADCIKDSMALLRHLADGGHKVSLSKLQFCQKAVHYLGYVLKDGCRFLSNERVKTIMDIKRPVTKKELLSFLGLINYSRQWLVNYASLDSVLRKATMKEAKDPIVWTDEMKSSFRTIKYLMAHAPALGLPDYKLPFHLYVSNDGLCCCAVLAQSHGGGMRPVAFFSKALPMIVQGMVPCLRAVASAAMMVQKSQIIVLAHPLTLHTTHVISVILNNITTQHMTSQRRSNYENILTATQNLTISTAAHTNPAIHLQVLLHGKENEIDEEPHDCLQLIEGATSIRSDLRQTPLPDADLTLFCDGSAMRPNDSTILAGYAVVNDQLDCIEAFRLPVKSAQAAELIALTRACIIAEGQRVNIYSDSTYAYKTAADYSLIWQSRRFLTSAGKEIQNANLVKSLLEAIMLPAEIAIMKCQAHKRDDSPETRGNNFADKCAKEAALGGDFPPWQNEVCVQTVTTNQGEITMPLTKEDLIAIQERTTEGEKQIWMRRGCAKEQDGLWKSSDGRIVLSEIALHPMIAYLHGMAHANFQVIKTYIEKLFFAVGLEKHVRQYIQQCLVCARCNPAVKVAKHEHLPLPQGPFQQLQIDFTHMTPACKGYRYLLVIVDRFSRWPEAYPTKNENAQTVVKCLMEHIIPRFGIPLAIDSDNGPSFVSKVTRLLAKALGIKWTFHAPYHPQSSGCVERANRTIKNKLLKIHMSRRMTWLDALPLTLMSMRAMPCSSTGFISPHEIVFGRPFPVAIKATEVPADLTNLQEAQQKYVHDLYDFVAKYLQQVSDASPVLSDRATHPFKPGDLVLVRSLKPTADAPIYGPPVEVLLVTRTAVKVKGTPAWIHASRIKAAPRGTD